GTFVHSDGQFGTGILPQICQHFRCRGDLGDIPFLSVLRNGCLRLLYLLLCLVDGLQPPFPGTPLLHCLLGQSHPSGCLPYTDGNGQGLHFMPVDVYGVCHVRPFASLCAFFQCSITFRVQGSARCG